MNASRLLTIAAIGFGFVVGIYVGIYAPLWKEFEIEPKISLGETAETLMTMLVAILVALVIERRSGNARAEKDLFIERTDAWLKELEKFEANLQRGQIPYVTVTSGIKRLRMSVRRLWKMFGKGRFVRPKKALNDLEALLSEMKDELTDDAVSGSAQTSASVPIKDGIITISAGALSVSERLIGNIKEIIYDLELEINGC